MKKIVVMRLSPTERKTIKDVAREVWGIVSGFICLGQELMIPRGEVKQYGSEKYKSGDCIIVLVRRLINNGAR